MTDPQGSLTATPDLTSIDCSTLYQTARSIIENNGDKNQAHQLFQEVITRYPETHEAQYASDFVRSIERNNNTESTSKSRHSLKLEFHGNAQEYFRIWIVNLCLTLLTIGVFSAWAKVRKKRYFYSHLTLDQTPFQYLGQPLPILKGRIVACILFLLYYTSTNIFTTLFPYVLGAGVLIAPWVIVQSVAFNARYSAFRNITFRFDGTYVKAFKALSAWGLIPAMAIGTIFSWWGQLWLAGIVYALFGIVFPWWMNRLKQFIVSHTSYGSCAGRYGAAGGDFFRVYFMAGLILTCFGLITSFSVAVIMGITASLPEKLAFTSPYTLLIGMLPMYAGYVLSYAYIQANITNTVWNQLTIGSLRFHCTLKGTELAKIYLVNAIAIIASAGMLIPWAAVRTFKYRTDHTQVKAGNTLSEFQADETETVKAAGAEVSEFFDLDLAI